MIAVRQIVTGAWMLALTLPSAAQDAATAARDRMISDIEAHAARAPSALEGGEIAPRVLSAMRAIPRHEFVPGEVRDLAYLDRPLPIGYGQTLLQLEASDEVLEIGTGSGYQAAVLSPLVDEVYSIEIVPELGRRAARVIDRLGLDNIETRVGDGYYGWPEAAPFDAIVVTAAASHIPPPLVQQLAPGGRMVIPVGGAFATQQLRLVEKQPDGTVTSRQLLPVRFVPFTRGG